MKIITDSTGRFELHSSLMGGNRPEERNIKTRASGRAGTSVPFAITRHRRRDDRKLRRAHDGSAAYLAQASELDEAGDGAGKGDVLESRIVRPGAAGERSRPGLAVDRDADLELPDAAGRVILAGDVE